MSLEETSHIVSLRFDMRHVGILEATWDMGHGTWDMRHVGILEATWDMGHETWDMQHVGILEATWDMGHETWDMQHVGILEATWDMGHGTWDMLHVGILEATWDMGHGAWDTGHGMLSLTFLKMDTHTRPIANKGLIIDNGEVEGGGGGQVKFYPYKKRRGGSGKSFSHAEGGTHTIIE